MSSPEEKAAQSGAAQNPKSISDEKLSWLKEIGAHEFEYPIKYGICNWIFSEEYLRDTPLEKLKEMYRDVSQDSTGYRVE